MKKKIVISTGGSGGHVIPATIFYEHLKNEFDVFLTTDKRGAKFINLEKYPITLINTPKLTTNIFLLPVNLIIIIFITIKCLIFFKINNINILISTGGYMSLPLCLAAKIFNAKIYLFEPNMVIGRANSFFLKYSKKIFTYSKEILNFSKKYEDKILLIEPLLRKEFYSSAANEKSEINNEIKLLILGGSQGAKLFDTEFKNSIINISKRFKLNIYHQINLSNKKNLENFYNQNKINYQLFTYQENILKFIISSNLCITRAGASTLSELTFLNIPYLAIPYPSAKDNHQLFNALHYKKKNCCWLLKQEDLKDEVLTKILIKIINNKEDYSIKKNNMKKFSYQITWNKINEKLINIINEN